MRKTLDFPVHSMKGYKLHNGIETCHVYTIFIGYSDQILQQNNSLLPGTKASQVEAKAKFPRDSRMSQHKAVGTIYSISAAIPLSEMP